MDIQDEALLKKTAPHNMEAEQAVIGAVILDNSVMDDVAEILEGADFYGRQYGLVYDAMSELYAARRPIDLVTLADKLKEKNAPEEMAGAEFFREILGNVPTSANAKAYARIVRDKSVLRKLIKAAENISSECYSDQDKLENILENAEKNIFEIVQTGSSKDFEPISEVVFRVLNKIQEAALVKGNITGLATGFTDLDSYTAGFQPSDFVLVAARPSMGKTAFALSIADNVVFRQDKAVAIFSLEMSREQLVNRLFAMEARIDAKELRTGNLSDQEWLDLSDSAEVIAASKLIIDDTPGISITELRSKCRKYKLENNIQLVVVDYIQLMSAGGKADNRQQEISEISRALKGIARELNIPVLVLSQLNRAVDTRSGDHKPVLSDIRESGAIEQDADVIMFLYREDYYNPETERRNVTDIIIAKHRNGPVGTVSLTWQPKYTRFVNSVKTVPQMN